MLSSATPRPPRSTASPAALGWETNAQSRWDRGWLGRLSAAAPSTSPSTSTRIVVGYRHGIVGPLSDGAAPCLAAGRRSPQGASSGTDRSEWRSPCPAVSCGARSSGGGRCPPYREKLNSSLGRPNGAVCATPRLDRTSPTRNHGSAFPPTWPTSVSNRIATGGPPQAPRAAITRPDCRPLFVRNW